jgi:hypothetical protein
LSVRLLTSLVPGLTGVIAIVGPRLPNWLRAVLVVACLLTLVRIQATRVEWDDAGLVVHNAFRIVRLAWADVTRMYKGYTVLAVVGAVVPPFFGGPSVLRVRRRGHRHPIPVRAIHDYDDERLADFWRTAQRFVDASAFE